jgi:integrase
MRRSAAKRRTQGSIRQRGSTYQVRVYAGIDPITNKPIYLTETAPLVRQR